MSTQFVHTTPLSASYSVYVRDLVMMLTIGVFLYMFDLPQVALLYLVPACLFSLTALKRHTRYPTPKTIWLLAITSMLTAPFLLLWFLSPNPWFTTVAAIHFLSLIGLLFCLLNAAQHEVAPQHFTQYLTFRIAKWSYLYFVLFPVILIIVRLIFYLQNGYQLHTIYDFRHFIDSLSILPLIILSAPVLTGLCLWAADRMNPIITQPQQKEFTNE